MTTSNESALKNKFVGTFLPWVVAVAGLIFYLATLNHWFSLNNIAQAARASGFLPGAELYSPLYFLLTYPLHWLPASWAPLALNLLSAVCAAATLGLLARSVTLLPHDRTHDQRLREDGAFSMLSGPGAWLPPVLAAAVLGLQLTIWEDATSGARELLDLLLCAYVIRCVLEYRLNERDSWLYRAAVVYGVAMTGNWVMIGLLPVFLVALIWIRGLSFFNLRFLRGLILCGLIGLLLYLVLPLIYVNSGYENGTFWQALKMNLKGQKEVLSLIVHRVPGNILLLLALTSFLPVFLIGVRWSSHFGDSSPMGIALTKAIFHISHGALLGTCLWAAFDPQFGPRHMAAGLPALILVLIYLAVLSIGYFSGYFLLVFIPLRDRARYRPAWKTALHRVSQTLLYLLLVLVPAGLIFKNLPRIQIANGPALAQYAAQLSQHLPGRAVVLSDDPIKLFLAKSWLERAGQPEDRLYLDTANLVSPVYFNQQQKLHPDEWLPPQDPKNPQGVDPRYLIQLLINFSTNRPVYYLHPSFGYYFEHFHVIPHGLAYELRPGGTNSIAPPPLTENTLAENETFWSSQQQMGRALVPFITEPPTLVHPTFRQFFLKKLRIRFEPTPLAVSLGNYYSLALNYWGVQAQAAGQLPAAGQHFEQAVTLNPNNMSAQSNLEFNQDLQAGIAPVVRDMKSLEDDFRKWQQVLREGGPFDEPTHRFAQGMLFGQGGLYRQAALQFERITALVPDYLPAQIWLAQFYVANRFPEQALALVPKIRKQAAATGDASVSKYDLMKVETTALFSSGKAGQAEQILRDQMREFPKDINLLSLVFQISTSFKSYTNALLAVDHALEIKPDDLGALVNKGYLSIQIGDFKSAIPALTAALVVETNNPTAKLNRAIAYLGAGQLEAARLDYADLEKSFPNAFQVYYGLGEIAWRQQDTNNAARYYDLYLRSAGDTSDEAKTISERLQSLRATPAP